MTDLWPVASSEEIVIIKVHKMETASFSGIHGTAAHTVRNTTPKDRSE
jgi:hypothetical protein